MAGTTYEVQGCGLTRHWINRPLYEFAKGQGSTFEQGLMRGCRMAC